MRINVLGPLEVRLPIGSASIKGAKRCALLAALLLHPGRVVSKTRLIDAVWDESPPSSATANIRTYVSDLRKSLGETGDGRPRLTSDTSGYVIAVGSDELDLLDFEKLADEGAGAAKRGDVARAARCLDGAARLWRGRPFDGIELGSWAQARIAALEDRRWDVLSLWVEATLALGRHEDLIVRLREMLAERPLSERTWAQLMVTLERMGRTSEALAVFAKARAVLNDELGIEPGPELRGVHQQIRSAGGTQTNGVATRTSLHRPCALPAVVPDFVGRGHAIKALTGWLSETGRSEMIVAELSGPPGAGKTTLAVRAAHTLRPAFPDGQLYHSLGGSTARPQEPAAVLAELLRSLAVAARDIPDGIDDRAALYRSTIADRRMLVVLDDAADLAQLRPLLPGTGACRAIVSTRARMTALEGVHLLRVGPLARREAVELIAGIIGRARVARDPVAASRIADACGCFPLGLRIAATRLAMRPSWPLATLAARLRDERAVLDELALGELSVRAGLASSYWALGHEAQRAVRLIAMLGRVQLSVGSVGAVLGGPEAESDRTIEQLVCANLLSSVDDPAGGEPTYRLDDLFRIYARERAEAEMSGIPRPEGARNG